MIAIYLLEGFDKLTEFFFVHIGIVYFLFGGYSYAWPCLCLFDFLKGFIEYFPIYSHGYRAIHHNKAPICIQSKAPISGLRSKTLDRSIGKTEIQDSLHHTGHRNRCPGSNRDEKRIPWIAKGLFCHLF